MLTRLLPTLLRPHRRSIAAIVALQFGQTLAALYLPTINADIIDNGVLPGRVGHILWDGGLMLGVSVAQMACLIGAVYLSARVGMTLGLDLRSALFRQVQRFSAREVGGFGTTSLVTRTINDVQQVQLVVVMALSTAIFAPLMAVGSVLLALRQSVDLSLLLLVVIPVLGLIVALIMWRMRPKLILVQAHLDELSRILHEQITGIRVIRAFVRDERERERFERASASLYDVSLANARIMGLMFPSVMAVINLATVAVVWFGGRLISDGSMQLGGLVAFLSYLMQVLLAIMTMTFMFVMLPRAEVSAGRVQAVLDTRSSVAPPAVPVTFLPHPGRLVFHDVGFRYQGAEQPVLSGIHLTAEPGEVVAIIGGTGSGKSTLLRLVPRLFDATSGWVRVGGVDVRDLDAAVLSGSIGYVPQRPYLFSGTVASNLRYGKPEATDAELWHALEVAQARAFVERLPKGLESPVAQGGTTLSGGQRQRLAIARALVRRADLYLFDDAFSALDYATDAALRAALADETANATVVIVAQRVSTVRDANRIVVLDDGRVAGMGSHEELTDHSVTYREILLSQSTGREVLG